MLPSMKALSVMQPYASEIEAGIKPIEYRTWRIAHRGPLLIVASKSRENISDDDRIVWPLGCAVCVVDLVDVTGEEGSWEWHVANPRSVERVPLRGYAAIYNVPDEEIVRMAKPPPAVAKLRRASRS
jgi:hypothetical protein